MAKAKDIPWMQRLNTKLGGITFLLLALTLALVVANLVTLRSIKSDAAHIYQFGRGRTQNSEYRYLAHRLFDETGAGREKVAADLRQLMVEVEERFTSQLNGDAASGLPPLSDEQLAQSVRKLSESWHSDMKPVLNRILATSSREEAEPMLRTIRAAAPARIALLEHDMERAKRLSEEKVQRFEIMQYAFIGVVVVILLFVLSVARSVARRTGDLAFTAQRVAGGELQIDAPMTGSDEIAALGESFNAMTAHLRRLIETEQSARGKLEKVLDAVAETTNALASGTSEILSGTTEQAAGAQQQAAAVAEAVTTVDEVAQTAEQAAHRAKSVAEASQRSVEISKAGRRAVEDTVSSMAAVKEQVESIAESILALAEQAQAIGEIIATVNDIAEQTNLLALNASIEASRAGEHGRGFAVVAVEVKALADQAKKATSQVRQILGDIQKATNSAVMSTEEGTKSVGATTNLVGRAGDTIKALSDTIAETAQAAAQIAASAGQQAAGMSQIHTAMKQVNQATNQNLASTNQQERAAQDLNDLGVKLKELMAGVGD